MSVEKRILRKLSEQHKRPIPFTDLLAYTDSFREACCVVGLGAKLIVANKNARELVKSHPALFKSANGLTLTHQTRARLLKARIHAVIFERRPQYLKLDNGCDEAKLTAILTPILTTDISGNHLHPDLALLRLIEGCFHTPHIGPLQQSHGLTPRQIDILRPFCDGFCVREAGEKVGVSTQRARELFSGIYQRLGLQNKCELIAFLSKLPSDPDI